MFDKGNVTEKEKKNLPNEELLEKKIKFPAKDIFVSLRG